MRERNSFIAGCLGCLTVLSTAGAGCSPMWLGDFRNVTDRKLTIDLSPMPPGGGTPQSFVVAPNGRKRIHMQSSFPAAVVQDADGRVLYEQKQVMPETDEFERFHTPGTKWQLDFLVAEDGIYPIPQEWRQGWRAHIDEIRQRPTGAVAR